MRKKYDVRELAKALEERNEAARVAAAQFALDVGEGRLNSLAEDFNQGQGLASDDKYEPDPVPVRMFSSVT